jgi:non-ribosomal peptide synthetase component F
METALTLKYDNLLMDEDYADAIFQMLVNHISRIQVYSDQETMLSILNHSPLQRPSPLQSSHSDKDATPLMHSGFLGTLREYSDRHALDYRSATTQFTMTYRQLDIVTTALAHKLRDSMCFTSRNAESIVPAYMEASPALYISWLAVLKAGFAFCPLPVGAPAIELQSIVQDICAAVVLTDGLTLCGRPWDPWYCDGDDLTVCLDVNAFVTGWMHTPDVPKTKTLPSVAETDLAYIMYSSSSLGMPVGVKMTHSAAASTIASYSKQIPSHMSKRGFRWLASSCPRSHTSVLEMFSTWWTGGTLCSVGPIHDLSTAINKVSATIITATAFQASTLDLSRVPSLRHLWCQDSIPSSLLQNLTTDPHTPYSMLTVLKLYAPPNSAAPATFITYVSSTTRDTVVGSPLPTTGALLLCPKTKMPVPLGSVGDLYISGPCLPSGYLNRPDLDAVFFLSHSVYGRLFDTGGRGRLVRDSRGELVVEVLKQMEGEIAVQASEGQSSGRESVASMVDSFTEVGMLEGDKEVDIADANVLSLVG